MKIAAHIKGYYQVGEFQYQDYIKTYIFDDSATIAQILKQKYHPVHRHCIRRTEPFSQSHGPQTLAACRTRYNRSGSQKDM